MEDDGADPLQQLAAIREAAEERQSQFEDEQNNPEAKGDGGRIGKPPRLIGQHVHSLSFPSTHNSPIIL